jgi:hypothetical protein
MSKVVSITTFVFTPSAASLRHPNVHQDDIGLQAEGLGDGVRAVGRLAGHLDVLLGVEDHAEARAH